MRTGQAICITANGAKGRIVKIDTAKGYIELAWEKDGGAIQYNERLRYNIPHIEDLVKHGTLTVYNELSSNDPNLLFKIKGKP